MNFLRRFGLFLLGSLLAFCLLAAPWSHVITSTIGKRDTVKGWLDKSGFYDKVVDSVLENANKQMKEGEGQDIPLEDPKVQSVVSQAFSPTYLKATVEKVLDGTYGWLEGETDQLEFSVDLTEAKQKLADGLGNYATSRAADLPTCTKAQSAQLAGNFDALSSPCLPAGVSAKQAGASLRQQVLSSEDFLKDTTFTSDDIRVKSGQALGFGKSEGKAVPIDEAPEYRRLQTAYKLGNYTPYLFGIVAALSAIGIIFLSPSKRSGLRRVSFLFITAGVVLSFSYLVISRGAGWLERRAADVGGETNASHELAANLVREISSDISGLLMWYALGLLILGIGGLIFAHFFRRGHKGKDLKQTEPTPPIDDSPKIDPAAKKPALQPPKPKPPKPPRKIQL